MNFSPRFHGPLKHEPASSVQASPKAASKANFCRQNQKKKKMLQKLSSTKNKNSSRTVGKIMIMTKHEFVKAIIIINTRKGRREYHSVAK